MRGEGKVVRKNAEKKGLGDGNACIAMETLALREKIWCLKAWWKKSLNKRCLGDRGLERSRWMYYLQWLPKKF